MSSSRPMILLFLTTLGRGALTLVSLLAPAVARAAPTQQYRLAVVELRNEAELRPSEIAYLTDQARTQASEGLPGERFLVMTRESIVALLPPGKTLADCAKSQCEVEVGRTIGADYIVTGEILRFGESLRLTLKVHECQSGAFLGSTTAKGDKVDDLESGLTDACGVLFAKVRSHAGVGRAVGGAEVVPGKEGRIGTDATPWAPNSSGRSLVKFTSDPAGAVVRVDGQLLCQSTPCSKLLPPGTVQVQMERERCSPRTEAVAIPADGVGAVVDWKLTPTFGWLTVRTKPDSLSIEVNGEPVGRSPVIRREVDSGTFEVRVADARYHETGERVVVTMGAERSVKLEPTPREGAMEVIATDVQGNDVVAKVSVDGSPVGKAPGTFKLLVGKYRVVVAGAAGGWRGEVVVADKQVTPVVAKLAKGVALGEQDYEIVANGEAVLRSELMWTVRDNGINLNWTEAKEYCETCRLGGYSDWRLPTIEELAGLYDKERSYKPRDSSYSAHIAKPFLPTTSYQWSSARDGSSRAFRFYFVHGKRVSEGISFRRGNRVLCVRRSGE